MVQIKLTQGAYRYRPEGSKSAVVVQLGDPPFDLPAAEAARLVGLGVAEYALPEVATPLSQAPPQTAGEPLPDGEGAGTAVSEPPAYSAGMKVTQLRDLMSEYGIPYKVGMSKADMVRALDALFEEDPDEDGGEPPSFEAEMPVL